MAFWNGGILAALSFLIAGGLQSCSTMDISSEKSPGADLSRYKTFAWAPAENRQRPRDPILDQNIRATLEQSLRENGFFPAAPDTEPDFLVNYSVATRVTQSAGQTYGTPYWGGYVVAPVETYQEGTLVVDFIDARSNTPFWRGVAEAQLESREQVFQEARNAAQRIVAEYREDEARTEKGG